MPVHVQENWPKFGADIFVWQEGPGYKIPYKVSEFGTLIPDENATVQYGEVLPMTLFIGNEIYLDLRKAMIGEALSNDDSLRDARMVRDRLLTLVEQTIGKTL